MRSFHDPWQIGDITIANRVMLAPLAGIGNWFVRLQAKRYGAGLAVSEMISSFAIHYGNEKTLTELLGRAPGRGSARDPAVRARPGDHALRRGARCAKVGADILDLNMGCPVPKVMKTGAGAAMIKDPDTAVAVAKAAREGSGLPVTVKLRGVDQARAAWKGSSSRGGSWTRRASPGSRSTRAARPCATRARRTTTWRRQLVEELPVPVIVSGGMEGAEHIRWVFEHTGCAAVMLARGALGNPWLFAQVLGERDEEPTPEEILAEWHWVIDRAEEHLGPDRAARYLRKFHPWYVERLGAPKAVQDALQRADTLDEQRAVLLLSCAPSAPVQA